MLSIQAIAVRRDRQQYYLQLSHEEYYLQAGEPLGRWVGRGAGQLGLAGSVEAFEFLSLLDGKGRDGETPLVKLRPGAKHDPGWDLTFSAPKGVSVLWAVGDEATREAIQAAHRSAVEATVRYLEDTQYLARRGPQGRRHETVDLVAMAFEHGTSRELEPQLHTHLLVMNAAVRHDGTTGAILSQPLYRRKLHLGAVYRYALAAELTRDLGLELRWFDRDLFDLAGVPAAVSEGFSTRRQQIQSRLAEWGLETPEAAAAAALATRRPKRAVARETLFAAWRVRARELGFGPEQALALVRREPLGLEPRAEPERERPVVEPQPERTIPERGEAHPDLEATVDAAVESLSSERGSFTREATVERTMQATQARPVPFDRLHAAVARRLEQADLWLEAWRTDQVYAKALVMEGVQERMLRQARALSQASHPGIPRAGLALAAHEWPRSGQRQELYEFLAGRGGRLRAVDAAATADLPELLRNAAHAWQLGGYEVQAVTPNGRAALEFTAATGIAAYPVRRWQTDLTQGWGRNLLHHVWMLGREAADLPTRPPEAGRLRLGAKSVLLVVDAGGLHLQEMALLVEALRSSGAVGLFCGDERVRPLRRGVDPGRPEPASLPNPFGALLERVRHPAGLREAPSSFPAWRQEAEAELAGGQVPAALRRHADEGRLTVADELLAAREALLRDWAAKGCRRPEEHLILAPDAAAAVGLNRGAQARRRSAGRLGDLSVAGERDLLYAGDRVEVVQALPAQGVRAGELGTIVGVSPLGRRVTVRLDLPTRQGEAGELPRCVTLQPADLRLGYALVAQPGRRYAARFVYGLIDGSQAGLYRQTAQAVGDLRLYLGLNQAPQSVRTSLWPLLVPSTGPEQARDHGLGLNR